MEGKSILLVDDQVHAFLAMGGLRAVYPDRGGVVDGDGVGGGVGGAGGHGHEAREEARHVAVAGDGLAWLVEGRLRDCVVARRELELHHVAYGGLDVVRAERERARLGADSDDVHVGTLRWSVVLVL